MFKNKITKLIVSVVFIFYSVICSAEHPHLSKQNSSKPSLSKPNHPKPSLSKPGPSKPSLSKPNQPKPSLSKPDHLSKPNQSSPNPFIDRPEVQAFITQMVSKYHFDRNYLQSIFKSVKVRPTVIKQLKAPLEIKPWYQYQMMFVTEWRIREGVKFWNQYANALSRAEREFGVPASIIVATIGVETKYGRHTGDFRVIDALVNIAFGNTTRATYFRNELKEFLLLTRDQHLNPLSVMGSYAGAIGQPQFMPSSYRYYAINFSRSGKIDLSRDEIDVIGSIANYYQKHGWKKNENVILPASMSKEAFQKLSSLGNLRNRYFTQDELTKNGVKFKGNLASNQRAKIIELQGASGPEYWLALENFNVIKRYNSSDLYAMAVYQLSYYITALKEKTHNV